MIEVRRSDIRAFRAVLKKMAVVAGVRDAPAVVTLHADSTGRRLQARNHSIAVEYALPGRSAAEELVLPVEALADCEARSDTPVRFEKRSSHIIASWQDKAVPQIKQYAAVTSDGVPPMPAVPRQTKDQPPHFLDALRDACATAGTDATRYAVTCMQLRGRTGQIIGTDGHQLLVQSGFALPWDDDVLVPAVPVFGCRELASDEPIAVGKSADHVTVRRGPWTLHLAVNKDGRFPAVDALLASNKGNGTTLTIDPQDAGFLLGNLDSLPGATDDHAPITMDANGELCVRAKGVEQPTAVEVHLARSQVEGRAVRVAMDRHWLRRALQLGFRRLSIVSDERPLVCRDEKRQYVWQPLERAIAVKTSADTVRLSSTDHGSSAIPPVRDVNNVDSPSVTPDREKAVPVAAAVTPRRVVEVTRPVERSGIAEVLVEAEAIQDLLRQAYTRSHQLVVGVRRYRKQARVVKTSLKALQELQHIDA